MLGVTAGGRWEHVVHGPGATAFASSPEGLRQLEAGQAPVLLGPPCDGGLAAAADEGGSWVLCLARPVPAKDEPGVLSLLRVEDGAVTARRVHAAGGPASEGVDLAPHPEGGLALAWHDAGPAGARVFVARVAPEEDEALEAVLVSAPRVRAGPPRWTRDGERLLLVHAETWLDGANAAGRVLVRPFGAALPREVVEVRDHEAPRPHLTRDERGLVMVFRDRRPGQKARLMARRLQDDLRPAGPARRVARADGAGRPSALGCGGALVTVAPRSWGRAQIIGARILDRDLRDRLPERQLYEWGARFEHVEARCEDGVAQLLVTERALPLEPPATLQRLALRCTE